MTRLVALVTAPQLLVSALLVAGVLACSDDEPGITTSSDAAAAGAVAGDTAPAAPGCTARSSATALVDASVLSSDRVAVMVDRFEQAQAHCACLEHRGQIVRLADQSRAFFCSHTVVDEAAGTYQAGLTELTDLARYNRVLIAIDPTRGREIHFAPLRISARPGQATYRGYDARCPSGGREGSSTTNLYVGQSLCRSSLNGSPGFEVVQVDPLRLKSGAVERTAALLQPDPR